MFQFLNQRRFAWIAACLGLFLLPGNAVQAERAIAVQALWSQVSIGDAIGDLVFTGGSRPLRVRLIVQRDGAALVETHDQLRLAYFQALLDQLDSDGDGVLNKTEASRLPPPPPPVSVLMRQRADDIFVAQGSGGADKNDDDLIDVDELRMFYETHEESLVRLTTVASPGVGDPLFLRLDEDRNRRLSQAEWEVFAELLQLDRNGNGVLTVDEVSRPAASTAQEFVAPPSGGSGSTAALVCSFDTPSKGPADLILLMRQSTQDGELSQTELSFAPAALALDDLQTAVDVGDDGVVEASFQFEGHRVQVQILPPAIRGVEQTQDTLLREFLACDLDDDGSVPNSTEVPEFLQESFGLLDHDGSGEVSREEIEAFLQGLLRTQAQLESTRMTMLIHEETRGLFSLVDVNGDGRLSFRETSALATDWANLAGGKDELRSGDIPRTTQIVLRPGSLPSPYNSSGTSDLGPPWFYRMDRNRDGDVDAGEFLGASELFNQMDSNSDSLVSAGEAIAADRSMRPAQ
jgi:Ca2+-binding EF-hand superfamily protein